MANKKLGFAGGSTDHYGFKKPENFDQKKYDDFAKEYLPVLERRSRRWEGLIAERSSQEEALKSEGFFAEAKLKRFIRKGVPIPLRPQVWLVISGAADLIKKYPQGFDELCRTKSKDAANAIDLDLNRTFPDNEYFQDFQGAQMKEDLSQVLHAVAVKHPDIGYCQGLNYLAGMLLLIMKSKEKAFWLFETMLVQLPDYYNPQLSGIRVDLAVCRELLRQKDPELDRHFANYDFDLLLVAQKWFICWFLESLPIETVQRIWDCLFNEGPKILFRVALTLIIKHRQKLLQCKGFAELVQYFQNMKDQDSTLNCHQLMEEIFKVPGTLSGSTIQSLRIKHKDSIHA